MIAQKDTSAPDLTIKVTGYQWKWGYDYVKGEGEGISFLSTLATPRAQIEGHEPKGEHYLLEVDNELVVPVGKKIRVITTAADVVHSWWVPAFGAKQDAIPGFLRDLWFRPEKTGTFRSQCVELCGKEHGFMPIVVRVVSRRGLQPSGSASSRRRPRRPPPATREQAWRLQELMRAARRSTPRTASPATRRKGRARRPEVPAAGGLEDRHRAEGGAHRHRAARARPNTAMQSFKAARQRRPRRGHHVRAQFLGKQGGEVQPAEVKPPAANRALENQHERNHRRPRRRT